MMSEWIKCSERMPDDTQMLLAFSQGEIVSAYWNYVMCPIEGIHLSIRKPSGTCYPLDAITGATK